MAFIRRIGLVVLCAVAVMVAVPALFVARAASSVDAIHPQPQIGSKLAKCSFTDIRYLPRALSDFVSSKDPVHKRAFVLVFTNTTCPLVQRYLPRLKQLSDEYRDQGVQFVAVDVGPDDSVLEIAQQAVEHDMPFPFVKDIDASCVAACGVDRTATAVLIDADFTIRYRGRIDDSMRLTGAAPGASHEELRDAIRSLLANEKIAVTETPVDGCAITGSSTHKPNAEIDYAKQIAPILERNCTGCHRPNTAAPFSLTSFEDVSGNAAMIAEVVDQRRMPPWYAAAGVGKFTNNRTMSAADRKTLMAWALAGAPHEGQSAKGATADASEKPKAEQTAVPQKPENPDDIWANKEWQMGEPDVIYEAPFTYDVPAEGYIDYKYTLLPVVFLHDAYIQAAEVQPSNPRVVHHSNLGFMPIGTEGVYARLITGYVPGVGPMQLNNNVASKIPSGSAIGLQIHLTTTGKPEKTKLRVGFRYPRYKVDKELHYLQLSNQKFEIPPFAAHYPVSRTKTLKDDITVYGFFAHMHFRGQDMTFKAMPPSGDPVTMLMIPNYSFNWQMPYYVPRNEVKFPAGTSYECLAHFDNTTFNPYNPDPSAAVHDGQQTFQEMMYGYMFYTKDDEHLGLDIDTTTGRAK